MLLIQVPFKQKQRMEPESGVLYCKVCHGEQAFDRLPILADALEEAGCADAGLVNHCRQPGVHVRGCWAIDLLLGLF